MTVPEKMLPSSYDMVQGILDHPEHAEVIFNSIDSVIWMLDSEFRILYSNKAAQSSFNMPLQSILGKRCHDIVHQTPCPISDCPVNRASMTKQRESTEVFANGRWLEVVVNPVIDASGNITAYTHIISDITSRKTAEETCKASEANLRALLESSPESVFLMSTDGGIMYTNTVTATRLNSDIPALMSGNIYDLIPPDVAEARKAHIRQVIDTGRPLQFEDERSGRTILSVIYPVFDNKNQVTRLAVHGIDITERKKLELRIRESNEQYRSLFQNNHAVLLVIDPETGAIVDANPAACRYYGYFLEELQTKNILDINTLTPDQIHEEMDRAKADQRNHFFFQHRLASGEIRPVEVYSGPVLQKGRQLLYSIVHDISDRRKAEEEKERLILELKDALSKIKVLKGLIPICASCKKIRDDQGFWQQMESYIKERSDAVFSHGICPECEEKLYPELFRK